MDTFLYSTHFQHANESISSLLREIKSYAKEKRIKKIKQAFPFKKTFGDDTAQGIAGLLSISNPFVPKDEFLSSVFPPLNSIPPSYEEDHLKENGENGEEDVAVKSNKKKNKKAKANANAKKEEQQ